MLEARKYGTTTHYVYKGKPTNKFFGGWFNLVDCKDRYEIWSLRVDSRWHNRGIGTKMLTEFLQQFAHDKPLFLYVVKENAIAIRLYEKVGFVICGEYPHGSYAWAMKYEGKV